MASGVHLYKHECYDCEEVEWSLLSTHEHQSERCSDDHHHHLTTDFHHDHSHHTNHCEEQFYKIEGPFVYSSSMEIDAPLELDLPIETRAMCVCLLEQITSSFNFEQEIYHSPPLDVMRVFEVYLL